MQYMLGSGFPFSALTGLELAKRSAYFGDTFLTEESSVKYLQGH